jgi:hypothetical protein
VFFTTLLFSKACCFSGIVLHLLALLKASMGVVDPIGARISAWSERHKT